MRVLRKRLVCTNRDDTAKNQIAIEKIQKRYVDKMIAKGWVFLEEKAYICEGNAFFYWERYLTLYKPNLKSKDDLDFIGAIK